MINEIIEEDCKNVIDYLSPLIPKIKGKSFLVAGATSFLGLNIVNTLVYYNRTIAKNKDDQCEIYALYHDDNKAHLKLNEYIKDSFFHMFKWDATENSRIIIENVHVDYIFYLCSIATTDGFLRQPVETMAANTIGLYNMLVYAKNKDIKGFLYFSSGAIYGILSGNASEIHEDDMGVMNHIDLQNVYAEGKKAGETLIKAFQVEYSVPAKSVRISHTYGPGIDINDGRVFSDFIKNIVNDEDIIVKSDGSAVRPFCYISDAVRAFFLILIEGVDGETYNMANPIETYSVGELAELLVEKIFSDKKIKVIYINEKGNIRPKKILINIDKLQNLGWKPKVSVKKGFRRVVECIER